MPTQIVQLGQWNGDHGVFGNNDMSMIYGLEPRGAYYRFPFIHAGTGVEIQYSGANIAEEVLSTHIHPYDGNYKFYIGTASKIYYASSVTTTMAARSTGYSAGVKSRWVFASFGDNVLATDYADAIQLQAGATGSFTTNNQTTAPNANEGVSADPKAKYLSIYQNQVMISYINLAASYGNLSSGVTADLVMFSQYDNSRRWGDETNNPSLRGAGWFYIRDDRGPITGQISMGQYAYVFKDRSTYIVEGAPPTWRMISSSIGCISNRSIVRAGELVYFMSWRGPAVLSGDQVELLMTDSMIEGMYSSIGGMDGSVKDSSGNTVYIAPKLSVDIYNGSYSDNAIFSYYDITRKMVYFFLDLGASQYSSVPFDDATNTGANAIICYDESSRRMSVIPSGFYYGASTFTAYSINNVVEDYYLSATPVVYVIPRMISSKSYMCSAGSGLQNGHEIIVATKFMLFPTQDSPIPCIINGARLISDVDYSGKTTHAFDLSSARVITMKTRYPSADMIVSDAATVLNRDGWAKFVGAKEGFQHLVLFKFSQSSGSISRFPTFYGLELDIEYKGPRGK